MTYVALSRPDYKPALGEPITVIGHPERRIEDVGLRIEGSGVSSTYHKNGVPEPTIFEGIISDITGGAVQKGSMIRSEGIYQLTFKSAGPGSNGAPVFDSNGKVIGISVFDKRRSDGKFDFFALPIKSSWKILKSNEIVQ